MFATANGVARGWTGDSLLGIFETGADAAGESGDAIGQFTGGAINTQTLMLIVLALAAIYVVTNSDAGEAAGSVV